MEVLIKKPTQEKRRSSLFVPDQKQGIARSIFPEGSLFRKAYFGILHRLLFLSKNCVFRGSYSTLEIGNWNAKHVVYSSIKNQENKAPIKKMSEETKRLIQNGAYQCLHLVMNAVE